MEILRQFWKAKKKENKSENWHFPRYHTAVKLEVLTKQKEVGYNLLK
jgi:hypothetical protein